MVFERSISSFNPIETTMVNDIPFDQRDKFVKDQRAVALLIVQNVDDDQERNDLLEMIGIKPYTRSSLYENRLAEKRVYKETYIKPEDRDESQTA